jgi:hypothetical protein
MILLHFFLRLPLVALFLLAAETGALSQGSDLDGLVRRSSLIFSGKVLKVRASAMPGVPVNDKTVIVAVEELFTPTGFLGDLTKTNITVQLTQSPPIQVGERAVFFTNGWIYGEGVAVVEVSHLRLEGDTSAVRRAINEAMKRSEDRKVRDRLERANLVIVGRVLETRPVKDYQGPISEYAPEWWEAVIAVEAVKKGKLQDEQLVILFPASLDEVWIDSPKFERGQEGVWILQRDQQEKGSPMMRLPGYTALDPLDFRLKEQLDYLTKLLGSVQ